MLTGGNVAAGMGSTAALRPRFSQPALGTRPCRRAILELNGADPDRCNLRRIGHGHAGSQPTRSGV
jgi:hypothetical protein